MLLNLLKTLQNQTTSNLFAYSIVVVDNDIQQSARDVVESFKKTSRVPIKYYCEPEQNIALARNRAVANANGNLIAFIDDDEFPVQEWLYLLFKALYLFGASGIQGPVKPFFHPPPPRWIVKGKFHERETYPTGHVLTWRQGRTGNLLFKKEITYGHYHVFDPKFGSGGEDQDFFRRMLEKGHLFIYCNEAICYEMVPPIRWKRSFILRKSLLRGKVAANYPNYGLLDIYKSLFAACIYSLALPFLFIYGQHIFMKYLEKISYHFGKTFAVFGIDIIREKYVIS